MAMRVPQIFREQFSRQLRRARRKRFMSRQALADRLGVSRQTVASWEMAICAPHREEQFGRVCSYLGIDGAKLMELVD